MSNNILKKLKDDSEYYGDFGKQFLSNSDIYNLLNNPKKFRENDKGLPLIMGGYFHTLMLEPNKLDTYNVIDASTRSTKVFKDYIKENNLDPYDVLLVKEVEVIENWADTMKSNFIMNTDIYEKGNIYEQPGVIDLFGLKWKGKADIITKDRVIDIKTTSNIKKWKWSSNDFNYDSQAYLYQQIFNKPVYFYIIDKKTSMLKISHATEETLLRGRDKVLQAVDIYNKFFSKDAEDDISQYIEYEQF